MSEYDKMIALMSEHENAVREGIERGKRLLGLHKVGDPITHFTSNPTSDDCWIKTIWNGGA